MPWGTEAAGMGKHPSPIFGNVFAGNFAPSAVLPAGRTGLILSKLSALAKVVYRLGLPRRASIRIRSGAISAIVRTTF
jgi:hypothetical protein